MNYYNDNDPTKAAWLRQLIEERLIPYGEVDERSICDVVPSDLCGYRQWHFFAGIGGWSHALSLAGWPVNRPVCTASCPCQPFSQTGLGLAELDPRHLWPHVQRLAREFQFPVIFGEQVASPAGRLWFAGVRADLEALGYEVGGADLCAASVSAPHQRQRLFWAAYADQECAERGRTQRSLGEGVQSRADFGRRSEFVRLGHTDEAQWEGRIGSGAALGSGERGPALRMGDIHGPGPQGWRICRNGSCERTPWADGVGVPGRDGKMRRIEPGILPLVDGVSDRVALIGGAGDATVPALAAEFIQAAEEARLI